MTTYFKEYVVRDFLKVVVVCSEEPHAVGDLPGLPYCFRCDKSISINKDKVCHSEEIPLPSGGRVIVEGTEVLGELRSISYIARGIDCSLDPEKLYREVADLVVSLCRSSSKYPAQTSE